MTLKRLFITIVSLFILCNWKMIAPDPIQKARWIIGTWEMKTSKGSTYETWTSISDLELKGKSYSIKGRDSTIFENIQLIQKQQDLFYIPTVTDQNNNLPVSFSLQSISDDQFIFENLKHDFPQFISYKKVSADSLVAEISGTINGKLRKQRYFMKKIK